MKSLLSIVALAILLLVAAGPCFALQFNKVVSKEDAKKLGVVIRSHNNGESGVKVSIEFVPGGELKRLLRVEVCIQAGGKCLVDAPLQTTHPTPGSVAAHFSTDAGNLEGSVLMIVVEDGSGARIGYQFKVKDFVEIEKAK